MSRNRFRANVFSAVHNARGKQANLTIKSRKLALHCFVNYAWDAGYQINEVSQIKEVHIQGWVDAQLDDELSKRTIQNKLAHLRTALTAVGRDTFAKRMSNAVLGVDGASRAGTKVPMPYEDAVRFAAAASELDPGVGAALLLQRDLGLRAQEAVRSVDSLAQWSNTLAFDPATAPAFVQIIHGTKGGRVRWSPPVDRQRALMALNEAWGICDANGGRLIKRADLDAAMQRYHYVVRTIGMVGELAPHSLRYGYATDHLSRLIANGMDEKEAAAAVALYLGHGDRRGRWVKRVYARTLFEKDGE